MPSYSFDVTSTIEMPEVDNAVNQARKKSASASTSRARSAAIDLDQKANTLTLTAEDNFKLESVWDVLQTRLIKRNVAVKNLKRGDIEPAAGSTVKQVITLQQGIPIEAAKDIVKHLKELKLKVQAAIQGEQVRITSASKDTSAGRDAGAAREGFWSRAAVWQLPLGPSARVADVRRRRNRLPRAGAVEARAREPLAGARADPAGPRHRRRQDRHRRRRCASCPSASPSPSTARTDRHRGAADDRPAQAARLRHHAIRSGRPQDRLRPARRSARSA